MMTRHAFLPVAALAALSGCTDPGFTGAGAAAVREATPAEVTHCAYITDIRMTPGVYGPVLQEQGLRYARNKVLADARDAGANTIVFEQATPGTDIYYIHAQAYRC